MTREETASFIRAYLDGDTSIGNIIPIRDVLESAIAYLKEQPSLPEGLDEAFQVYSDNHPYDSRHNLFKAGAEWMAKQGVTKEAVIGMATEEISINVSQKTLDALGICPGDKVILQIRKAESAKKDWHEENASHGAFALTQEEIDFYYKK